MAEPQGTAPVQPQSDDTAPKYVTEEQINKAITSRFKSFEKKFEEYQSGLMAKLEDMFKKPEPQTEQAVAQAQQQQAEARAIEESPVFKGLQKQLAELKRQADESKAQAEAERAKARDTSLRQRLADELAKVGVGADRLRHAVGFLVDAEKRVNWDSETGELVFRDSDGDVDLATGLKQWSKTEDGKLYMPPRGVGGSGDRPLGGNPPGRPEQVTREQVAERLLDHLMQRA